MPRGRHECIAWCFSEQSQRITQPRHPTTALCHSASPWQRTIRLPLLLAVFLVGVTSPLTLGQVNVQLSFARTLYIRFEPLLGTVSITNLTGQPLLLADSPDEPWFSFTIEDHKGRPIPPRGSLFGLAPVAIAPGETIRRTVNITPLYRLDDYGRYIIRATVFDAQSGRHFSSAPRNVEITEGRVLWQQTVGHPAAAGNRQITLLSHRLKDHTAAYLRIQDPQRGTVFCTHRLGPIVTYGSPQVELDAANEVHVLQMTSPRLFLYSHIGLNGEVRSRSVWSQFSAVMPTLRPDGRGRFEVANAVPYNPEQRQHIEAQMPGVGDRPVPLPTPQAQPAPEPRPGLRLWPFSRRQPAEI